jgi:hypothetical protein
LSDFYSDEDDPGVHEMEISSHILSVINPQRAEKEAF